jgi:uncharacterized protein YdiU (UPF0061 family)
MADLFEMLWKQRVDYTRFFRALSLYTTVDGTVPLALRSEVPDATALEAWLAAYRDRLITERSRDAERQSRMARVNPVYILRNWLAERAIRKAEDERDFTEIERLRRLLRFPFSEQPHSEEYTESAPAWARDLVVSCSS